MKLAIKSLNEAQHSDELSIKKGDFVYVLEKNLNGWWKTKHKITNQIGLAPAIYLRQTNETNLSNYEDKLTVPAFTLFRPTNELLLSNNDTKSLDSFNSLNSHDSFFTNSCSNNSSFNSQQPITNNLDLNQIYYALDDYIDEVGDGVNLTRGKKVMVLSKDEPIGWWYVQLEDGTEGWAPGGYLSLSKPPPPLIPKPPKTSLTTGNATQQNNRLIFNKQESVSTYKISIYDEPQQQKINDYQPVKVSNLKKLFEKN